MIIFNDIESLQSSSIYFRFSPKHRSITFVPFILVDVAKKSYASLFRLIKKNRSIVLNKRTTVHQDAEQKEK